MGLLDNPLGDLQAQAQQAGTQLGQGAVQAVTAALPQLAQTAQQAVQTAIPALVAIAQQEVQQAMPQLQGAAHDLGASAGQGARQGAIGNFTTTEIAIGAGGVLAVGLAAMLLLRGKRMNMISSGLSHAVNCVSPGALFAVDEVPEGFTRGKTVVHDVEGPQFSRPQLPSRAPAVTVKTHATKIADDERALKAAREAFAASCAQTTLASPEAQSILSAVKTGTQAVAKQTKQATKALSKAAKEAEAEAEHQSEIWHSWMAGGSQRPETAPMPVDLSRHAFTTLGDHFLQGADPAHYGPSKNYVEAPKTRTWSTKRRVAYGPVSAPLLPMYDPEEGKSKR